MDKKLYRYYCPMRPPMLGAIPKDGLVKAIDFGERTNILPLNIKAWGEVIYNRRLSEKEVYNYELVMHN